MPVSEIYGFDGVLITTDLNTTQKALNAFGWTKILFYIWDLEWLRMPQKRWHDLIGIYGNEKLSLVCRSEEHLKAVRQCWNIEPIGVVEDFDWAVMRNLIRLAPNKLPA